MKTPIAAFAALSLALAPLSAQANTRAADASVSLAGLAAAPAGIFDNEDDEACERDDLDIDEFDGDDDCGGGWLWVLGAAGVMALFVILLEDGEDGDFFASPGT
ncbi:hypothetical protein [Aurantiacibacter gangjinensis]|uniref:Uncharacterized protein n=1 Tax=Aurantiacibacter gangjinensis TaxID=502682 RepID=A0A0G9ML14_9SPHN|nr:hypothetical protein [Aurantiacibacter gangjinensis]APE27320.1 hypothetical protein BMF35_a0491 [Aurantiacibacter gangjinensis]KLE31421.1 hypothetical protein AAW01_07440 [Aurantiacibacter gangjinensis]